MENFAANSSSHNCAIYEAALRRVSLGDALPHCWFHTGCSKGKSILPVKLDETLWSRAKHLGTPPQLGWQRAWPGQMPGDSFTSAPSAAFLGCHQSQPHSHPSKPPGSASPQVSAQAYTTWIDCFCKWTLTAKWHFPARPASGPPCTDREFYPSRSSSLRCPKHNSSRHLPQIPTLQPPLPCHTQHLLEFTSQFPAIPLDGDQDNYANMKIYDLHRDGIVDSIAK